MIFFFCLKNYYRILQHSAIVKSEEDDSVHRNVIKEIKENIWFSVVGHFPAFKWRKLAGR